MIKLLVDEKRIGYYNVSYNYQKNPKPGGHKYKVEIPFFQQELIGIFERMGDTKISDADFISKIKTLSKNSFNLIQWTIDYLDIKRDNKQKKATWVFNNIEEVYIKNDKLIMEGVASKAYDSYEEFHEACKKNGK